VELLRAFLAERADPAVPAHQARYDQNPLRVLDCKTEECEDATEARRGSSTPVRALHRHFARVRAGLDALDVPYTIDHRLVRGFDYYTRTTFEFASGAIDAAQNASAAAAATTAWSRCWAVPRRPGIGFGIGIERMLIACDAEGVFPTEAPPLDAYVIDVTGGSRRCC
jgi:histidyl-tRNA synthetase